MTPHIDSSALSEDYFARLGNLLRTEHDTSILQGIRTLLASNDGASNPFVVVCIGYAELEKALVKNRGSSWIEPRQGVSFLPFAYQAVALSFKGT